MLPAEDPTFIPSANTPFLLELRLANDSTSSSSNNVLADSSTFVTSPFLGEDFTMDLPEVPVTDTRQSSSNSGDTANVQTGINLNVNVGLNTLNNSNNTNNTASNDSFIQSVNLNDGLSLSVDLCNSDETAMDDDSDSRTFVGCSKFTVTDINGSAGASSARYNKQMSDSSTLTSPKLNSVNVVSDCKQRSVVDCAAVGNANGLITQLGMDGKEVRLMFDFIFEW